MPDRKCVLVVEDEMLIAMEMADTLHELGYDVAGPSMHLEEAIAIAGAADLDAAVLDVNLGGGLQSFPVAEVLTSRSIPFLFATGYGPAGVAARYSAIEVLKKPVEPVQLAGALQRLFLAAP